MRQPDKEVGPQTRAIAISCFLLVGLLLIGSDFGLSGDRVKPETIDATAMGTGTQLGQNIGVTVIIYDYSTPATGRS
jgi:hypothetical protein